jgi:hypothetical protein
VTEITPTNRMNEIETLINIVDNNVNELPTFDDLDTVVSQIFDDLTDIENRIKAIENILDMIERIISPTDG